MLFFDTGRLSGDAVVYSIVCISTLKYSFQVILYHLQPTFDTVLILKISLVTGYTSSTTSAVIFFYFDSHIFIIFLRGRTRVGVISLNAS